MRNKDNPTAPSSQHMRSVEEKTPTTSEFCREICVPRRSQTLLEQEGKGPFGGEAAGAGDFDGGRPRETQGFRIWGGVGDGVRKGSA